MSCFSAAPVQIASCSAIFASISSTSLLASSAASMSA